LIYAVTALLSTNLVAECIISTHWRGVVHLQGCNQFVPNFVSQKLSRKLVHITSGLLFALCWPFFRSFPYAIFLLPYLSLERRSLVSTVSLTEFCIHSSCNAYHRNR
jgi:hypothetical protein